MRRVILGTDWWTDCDDAVAIRVLARAVKTGVFSLAGVVVNAAMPDSAASICGYLDHEGLLDGTPVALDADATDFGGHPSYQHRLAETLGRPFADRVPEAPLPMLRRVLAAADEPLEMIEIGYPQCLAALLESAPDALSPLDGLALVREKVSHLWMMAGNYADEAHGRENNFARNARSARGAAVVTASWPTPITFLGWEVGATVISGSHLPPDDVLARILADHGSPHGRSSWDPLTVHLAMCGSPEAAGYDAVRGFVTVDPVTGENSFRRDAAGPHEYVRKRLPDAHYAAVIDAML